MHDSGGVVLGVGSDCTSAFQSKRLTVTIFYTPFKEKVTGKPLPGPIIILCRTHMHKHKQVNTENAEQESSSTAPHLPWPLPHTIQSLSTKA